MSYSIKDVSQKYNLSTYTLRYYEREGLLRTVQRNENNKRFYTDIDLGWIEMICCMRATGMSISYIKNYIDLCVKGNDTLSDRRKIMLDQREIIKEHLKKYTDLLELVDMKLDYYDKKVTKDELKKIIIEKRK